jgi:polyferredoxin
MRRIETDCLPEIRRDPPQSAKSAVHLVENEQNCWSGAEFPTHRRVRVKWNKDRFDLTLPGSPSSSIMRSTTVDSQNRRDLLTLPFLGRAAHWRYGRTVFQSAVFLAAAVMLVDGLIGSPLAAKNTATIGAWVHYRGLIVLALLFVGNLFCAGCPFLLTRGLARRLGRPTKRWPKALRNKWLAIGALVGMLFVYEWLDLWASPWLTAWVIIAYFVAAFLFEAFFTRDTFCLYVCPLGTFNFLYSSVSPTQVTNRRDQTCRDCVGHECINGQFDGAGTLIQQGCQLELYVPTIQSNLNCTLCMDCVRACPHDNVALVTRAHSDELLRRPWHKRLDYAMLAVVAAFLGLLNAFAMTPPVYGLQTWLADLLNTNSEFVVLGFLFAIGVVVLPLAAVFGAAWVNRLGERESTTIRLRDLVIRYAYAFVPVGFAIWTAHYLFHFLIGPLTIVPALQAFFAEVVGIPLLGQPDWTIAARAVTPLLVIRVIQLSALAIGLWLGGRTALRAARDATGRSGMGQALPWLLILLLLTLAAAYIFLQPMEMRGNVLG